MYYEVSKILIIFKIYKYKKLKNLLLLLRTLRHSLRFLDNFWAIY